MKKLLVALLIVIGINTFAVNNKPLSSDTPYASCQLSTVLDSDNNPKDIASSISMHQKKFYVNLEIKQLVKQVYKYECDIFNENDRIVYSTSSLIHCNDSQKSFYTEIQNDNVLTSEGEYTVRVYLDNVQVVDKKFKVNDMPVSDEAERNKFVSFGLDNIIRNEKNYDGGSYGYASFGYKPSGPVYFEVRYSFSLAPSPAKEQMVNLYSAFYVYNWQNTTGYIQVAPFYNNDLSGHDSGSIGIETSIYESKVGSEQFSLSLLPVYVVYNIHEKAINFGFELLKFRFCF
jgi:hypothetical protein